MKDKQPVLSEIDFGGWAEHYAKDSGFYGHFKDEIYPLFIEFLSQLPDAARVLDIGAGPGNFAAEFYKANPDSDLSFVLVDASKELLRIAEKRLEGHAVSTMVRSFNMEGWQENIEAVDAITSNNALFHIRPENLQRFYSNCFTLLNPDGILLNQQSFGYSSGESPYGKAPFLKSMGETLVSLFPGMPDLSEAEKKCIEDEKTLAQANHAKALEEARASGVEIKNGQSGYQFLAVEDHLRCMREAGFAAGCIWRKREFAVVFGTKNT
jgi:2-polyprenyl-3-methyl-5-hydroxy-6-metoxy-1,4-benzoquinol methylase